VYKDIRESHGLFHEYTYGLSYKGTAITLIISVELHMLTVMQNANMGGSE